MDCTTLPATGFDAGPLIALGALVLVAGLVLMIVNRRRTAGVVLAGLLIVLGFVGAPMLAPGQAASAACVTDPGPHNSLTVVQTSTMTGMAPGVAPAAIEGRVTNVSTDDTYIMDVVVSIFAVTKADGASAGSCDASDYLIVAPTMLVGVPLEGGESTAFAGASIGFAESAANQDACQGATVTLLYRTG